MKVIDLLNKIANEEELPKRIFYKGYTYNWFSNQNGYYRSVGADVCIAIEKEFLIFYGLNDKIEVIEDPKEDEFEEIELLDTPYTKNENDLQKQIFKIQKKAQTIKAEREISMNDDIKFILCITILLLFVIGAFDFIAGAYSLNISKVLGGIASMIIGYLLEKKFIWERERLNYE